MKKNKLYLMIVFALIIIGTPLGIIQLFAYRDFFDIPGKYGIISDLDFFTYDLSEIESGQSIIIGVSSSKPVIVGITEALKTCPCTISDFIVYDEGTNIKISWIVSDTGEYKIVINSKEIGDTYFSLDLRENITRKFPVTLLIVEAITGVISLGTFYCWYKIFVEEGWKIRIFGKMLEEEKVSEDE